VVLVVGGSQGSLAINERVAEWIRSGGTASLTILWATGKTTYHRFRELDRPPAVQVFEFLDPIADAYAVADLVISRAGMTTIAEICAWGLASILIPLPTAAADHQTKNAAALAEAGAAVWLPQDRLTAGHLGDTVTGVLGEAGLAPTLRANALRRGKPSALSDITSRLERLLPGV
jgi:UDP-N-acetylglucosamine--N-acetylmuramyl-(pentapeptide) pyrophosphoryl-undecaprenol N-acetylglucosamine transferase